MKIIQAVNSDTHDLDRWNVPALVAYYVTLSGFFVASFFPEYRVWGINWWAYYPLCVRFGLLTLGLIALLGINQLAMWFSREQRQVSNAVYSVFSAAIILMYCSLFYLLRTRTHFLGDGYQVLARVERGDASVGSWTPLLHFIQTSLYSFMGSPGQETALLTLRTISWTAGIMFLLTVMLAAKSLFVSNRERILFVLGIVSGGYMLLFFGYVENYPLFILTILVFALVGLLSTINKLSRWWIILPTIVSYMLHPFGVCLIPSAIYVLLANTAITRRLTSLLSRFRWAFPVAMVLVFGGSFAYFYMQSHILRFALVQLLPNRFMVERYWLFSFKHLADYANLLLLLFPGFLVVLAYLRKLPLREFINKAEYRFLLTMLFCCLGIVFLIEPKLGMPRDWDLFSLAGVPLVLLSLKLVLEAKKLSFPRTQLVAMCVLLGFLVLGPRAISLAKEETAIKHVTSYFDMDEARNSTGRATLANYLIRKGKTESAAAEVEKWRTYVPIDTIIASATELRNAGKPLEAIELLREALDRQPNSYKGWECLGACYFDLGNYDSALICAEVSDGVNPNSAVTHDNLGMAYYRLGQLDAAKEHWSRSIDIDSTRTSALMGLCRVYESKGLREEYVETIFRIAVRDDAPLAHLRAAVILYSRLGQHGKAVESLRRAIGKGLDSSSVRELVERYPELQGLL